MALAEPDIISCQSVVTVLFRERLLCSKRVDYCFKQTDVISALDSSL